MTGADVDPGAAALPCEWCPNAATCAPGGKCLLTAPLLPAELAPVGPAAAVVVPLFRRVDVDPAAELAELADLVADVGQLAAAAAIDRARIARAHEHDPARELGELAELADPARPWRGVCQVCMKFAVAAAGKGEARHIVLSHIENTHVLVDVWKVDG